MDMGRVAEVKRPSRFLMIAFLVITTAPLTRLNATRMCTLILVLSLASKTFV